MRYYHEINGWCTSELERLVLYELNVSHEAHNEYVHCCSYHAQVFAGKLYEKYKTECATEMQDAFAESCVWYASQVFDGVKEGMFADWVMGNLLVLRFNRTFDGVSLDDVDERVSAIRAVAKTCGGLEWKLS